MRENGRLAEFDTFEGMRTMTVFEHVEKLKRDYTGRFVLVAGSRPELARFQGQTGRVKTVNMSGRALVEFEHDANIGWIDIDVDYLKVVDRPLPEKDEKPSPPTKTVATKAAPDKQLSPLEIARMQDAGGAKKASEGGAKQPAAGKMSTADILAAARGTKSAAAEPKPKAAAAAPAKGADEMTLTEKLAAARGEKAATAPAETAGEPPQAAAPAKGADEMTLTEKLAAARGQVSASPENTTESTAASSAAETDEDAGAAEETAVAAEAEASASAAPEGAEVVDTSTMSVADIIAWCRAHDGP